MKKINSLFITFLLLIFSCGCNLYEKIVNTAIVDQSSDSATLNSSNSDKR